MAMSAFGVTKIIFKHQPKMSLSDRFANLKPVKPVQVAEVKNPKILQERQASAKNRRLAQQMERRPTVIAALKLKKRSMNNRLGGVGATAVSSGSMRGNIHSRLSLGGHSQQFRRGGSVIRGRISTNKLLRSNAVMRVRQGGVQRAKKSKGISPLLKNRLGNANRGQSSRGRGYGRGSQFNQRTNRRKNINSGIRRGNTRGGRGNTRGGRGRGSQRGNIR
ncbi:CHTOP (predicted) [Pycnogonum litorale]